MLPGQRIQPVSYEGSDLGCVGRRRYAGAVGRDTMTQQHSSHQEPAMQEQRQQARDTEHELVTLATLDAERDLGPMFDDEPSEIYLDHEDFLASLPPYKDSQ